MADKIKGNIAMAVSKTFSGLNQNAQRFLVPHWMSPFSGAVLRLGFGTLFFWAYDLIAGRRQSGSRATAKQAMELLAIGFVCVFGYMFFLLEGLSYTTPVSSSIFLSLEPVWVYIICLIIKTEKLSTGRVTGIAVGIAGAMVIVLTGKSSAMASDPVKGDMFCMLSAFLYSCYLIFEKRYLRTLSSATVSKWTFGGGLLAAIVAVAVVGWDAEVLKQGLFSTPMLVLLFVLVFPTAVSYLLLDVGLKNLPATVVALYGNLILVVSAVAGYILGQDKFSWWQMLAIALMAISVYLVEVAEKTNQTPAPGVINNESDDKSSSTDKKTQNEISNK